MKDSNITAIQKQLSNGYQTIVRFGKRIRVELTTNQIERLQNQLRIARALMSKQLWISKDCLNPTVSFQMRYKVQGTYNYSLHGELNQE